MIEDKAITEAISRLFEEIEFPAQPTGLYDPLRYMISIGGKRLRPHLCLLAWSLYRDALSPEVLDCAAALEVFHTFTLIHDDIMDRSPMRRAHDTVWKKWDEDTAILSGDVMCIDSYRRLCSAPAPVLSEVLSLFSDMAAKVCEGQQYDMDFESLPRVSKSEYMEMIGLKTGALIAASAKMGAVLAGASAGDAGKLYDYGYTLGLAFQVADDYLDTYGDSAVFGKPIGGDILNGKKTWLFMHALEKAESLHGGIDAGTLLREMAFEAVSEEEKAAKIAKVRALYDALGVGEDARAEVRRLSALALDAVSGLAAPDAYAAAGRLRAFADALVGRAK